MTRLSSVRRSAASTEIYWNSSKSAANNPYCSVRFRDSSSAIGYSYQAENYPRTRNSDAVALRGEYRFYKDSWGINAHNGEVSYTHPIGDHWEFDANLRYYDQTNADFYVDIFAFQDAQNFLARDKELAALNSTSIGAGASYSFGHEGFWSLSKGSANLYVKYVMFDY
jgi:membrane-bound inhibitor of C-type lysozyme